MTEVSMSVVVPVLNGARTIGACLDALAAQRDAPPWELLVVDNGSQDDTAAVVRSHPVGARLLHEPQRGSYAARNTGIRAANGTALAFTDADCVPEPMWLAAGTAALEGGASLVGGRVVQLIGSFPTSWEVYDARHHLDQRSYIERHGFAATANLFVWRHVFDDVGLFDCSMFSSGDVEFSRRATAGGHQLVYADGARVGHWPRTTLRGTWKLHRRIGAGQGVLRARTTSPPARRPARLPLRRTSPADWRRRLQLLPVHVVVVTGRWTGRLTKRG